jgi:hypothetical protein
MSSIVLSPRNFHIDDEDLVAGASSGASQHLSVSGLIGSVRGVLSPSDSGPDLSSGSPPATGRAMYFSTLDGSHDDDMGRRSGDYRAVSNSDEHPPHHPGGLHDKAALSDHTGGLDPSAQPQPSHMYGSFTGYCFTVNYVLGVGCLGMPYAFYKGGWALSSLLLMLVSVMASFTALWLVDVSLRAQYIKRQDRLLLSGELDPSPEPGSVSVQPPVSTRTHHRFEMNELVEMFLGQRARRFYEVLIIIYLVGALWSYTSVFASSLASHVPLPGINGGEECDIYKDHGSGCSALYYTYVGMFAVVAIPLTCLDLTEMKAMQVS